MNSEQGFFRLFAQGGGMRLYGLLGGHVCICVQSVRQTRGIWGHAPLEFSELLLHAIWWNLGLFLHITSPFIVPLKLL